MTAPAGLPSAGGARPSLGRSLSVAVEGILGHMVEIEADIGQSLPAFVLLGLPDSSLIEAKERIRSAAKNSGYPLPARKLTVNLLPAGMPKHGPGFDLGILMAALQADGAVTGTEGTVFLGELSLDGRLRAVRGILPAVMAAVESGAKRIVCPRENHREAALVPGAEVFSYDALPQVLEAFGAVPRVAVPELSELPAEPESQEQEPLDFSEVRGQAQACRAALVAAAGGHHLMLMGPPGVGKTLIAQRLPGLLPKLDDRASLEVSAIHSASGALRHGQLITTPPLEQPHHSATPAAMLGGGGRLLRPGAVSRAHRGVLFLDEACEFERRVLDGLRQPLESGAIDLQRAAMAARFPARFQLVIATNPCPCGMEGSLRRACTCTAVQKRRYFGRLSGPIMDRLDLRVVLSETGQELLAQEASAFSTAEGGALVLDARLRSRDRLSRYGLELNAHVPGSLLRGELSPEPGASALLESALLSGRISARGYDRILRLAWTLADLSGKARPTSAEITEAVSLREPAGACFG